mmetsp:Transcript_78169/g.216999  ORF Transcript_78169/g.216999 Transcript_78169/m.216999 type:complete len:239 (-) Transcript_78169:777-1493(-)
MCGGASHTRLTAAAPRTPHECRQPESHTSSRHRPKEHTNHHAPQLTQELALALASSSGARLARTLPNCSWYESKSPLPRWISTRFSLGLRAQISTTTRTSPCEVLNTPFTMCGSPSSGVPPAAVMAALAAALISSRLLSEMNCGARRARSSEVRNMRLSAMPPNMLHTSKAFKLVGPSASALPSSTATPSATASSMSFAEGVATMVLLSLASSVPGGTSGPPSSSPRNHGSAMICASV